jgi:hypothetical protein
MSIGSGGMKKLGEVLTRHTQTLVRDREAA